MWRPREAWQCVVRPRQAENCNQNCNPTQVPHDRAPPRDGQVRRVAIIVSFRYVFGMPGRNYLSLLDVANGQYGYVTAEDARELGIDPGQLRLMNHRQVLDRLSVGLYRFPSVPTTPLDQYMEATLWPRVPTVLSHETALDLHDVCDVNPARVHLTVPPDYRLRRDLPAMYQLHPRHLDALDITGHEGIPIVTVRRAILDGIEAGLGGHLIDQAVTTAQRRGLLSRDELSGIADIRENRSTRPRSGVSR